MKSGNSRHSRAETEKKCTKKCASRAKLLFSCMIKTILIPDSTLWIPVSRYWIPDSLSAEGIPDFLCWFPDFKAQGSGFHKKKTFLVLAVLPQGNTPRILESEDGKLWTHSSRAWNPIPFPFRRLRNFLYLVYDRRLLRSVTLLSQCLQRRRFKVFRHAFLPHEWMNESWISEWMNEVYCTLPWGLRGFSVIQYSIRNLQWI